MNRPGPQHGPITEGVVLHVISVCPGITIPELASVLEKDKSTIFSAVRALRKQELIEPEADYARPRAWRVAA